MGGLYSLSQVMVNNISVNFNTVLLRELCMIYYLPRGLASAANFFSFLGVRNPNLGLFF